MSLVSSIQFAVQLLEENRLEAAEVEYLQMLKADVIDSESLQLLGLLALRLNHFDEAISLIRRAVAVQPADPVFRMNLAMAYESIGDWANAIGCYRRMIELDANSLPGHFRLANVLYLLHEFEPAIAEYRESLRVSPESAEVCNHLGMALHGIGRFSEAAEQYRAALRLSPNEAGALNNLGYALQKMGLADEALLTFRQAMRLKPESASIANNLGNLLKEVGRLDEAIACYDHALQLQPIYPDALNNLGNALKDSGRIDQAIAAYEQAIEERPDYTIADSARCYTLHFHPDFSAEMIYCEHCRWNDRHAKHLRGTINITREPAGDRRLRIGYVSPDFREHVVGRFLLPLLENHDRSQFEIFCYSDVEVPDELTARLRTVTDHWRNTVGLSDEKLAEVIREEVIDILVDLTMHMGSNRMLTFARKPAPIQVTYLAYCSTTGLDAMDYRITDPFLDPVKRSDKIYSETSLYLPETYWCYRPMDESPKVAPLPAMENKFITFGCFNNFCKISQRTIVVWCELLNRVPRSRLILHSNLGSHRQAFIDLFEHAGVTPDRIEFVGFQPVGKYFELYHHIDIALDPFPYNGGTTTCDALWMGVPVITLAGETAVARGGVSILSNVGCPEWIAATTEAYITIAKKIAGNFSELQMIRSELRDRMIASPLMKERRFAENMEGLFRDAVARLQRLSVPRSE